MVCHDQAVYYSVFVIFCFDLTNKWLVEVFKKNSRDRTDLHPGDPHPLVNEHAFDETYGSLQCLQHLLLGCK